MRALRWGWLNTGLSVVALMTSACAADMSGDGGVGGGPGESLAQDEEATTGNRVCDETMLYTRSVGATLAAVTGPQSSLYVCWLSAIANLGDKYSPSADVYVGPDGRWVLLGKQATMSCTFKDCFYSNDKNGTDQRWVSPIYSTIAVARSRGQSTYTTTQMWDRDTMPMLTGFKREGTAVMKKYYDEGAAVAPSNAISYVEASAYSPNGEYVSQYVSGYSFFVGVPYNDSSPRRYHQVKYYTVGRVGPNTTVQALSARSGICTIGELAAMYETNAAVSVRVNSSGVWEASNTGTQYFTPACYLYNQDN